MSKIKLLSCFYFISRKNTSCVSQWLPWALSSKCALERTESRCRKWQLNMEVLSIQKKGDVTESSTTLTVVVIPMESCSKTETNRWHHSSAWWGCLLLGRWTDLWINLEALSEKKPNQYTSIFKGCLQSAFLHFHLPRPQLLILKPAYFIGKCLSVTVPGQLRFTDVWHLWRQLTLWRFRLFGEKFAEENSVSDVDPCTRNKVADHAKRTGLAVKLHTLIKHQLRLRKSQFYLDIRGKFLTTKTWYGNNFHWYYYWLCQSTLQNTCIIILLTSCFSHASWSRRITQNFTITIH